MTTGKVLIRRTNKIINGKKVYIICGVVAFDNEVEAEKLYLVQGSDDILFLSNPIEPPIDIGAMRVDQILTSKVWQV